jgi:glyoxylase-like metal-dependent hydrolase (beta-lactamase superfamily II)
VKPIQIDLPTGLPVGQVNAYLFTEPVPTLVDTGVQSEASWAALQAALAEHKLVVADLVRVVISHPHVDHFGQAAMIAQHSDAEVWVADLGLPWVLDFPTMWQKRLAYYRGGFLRRLGLTPEAVDLLVEGMSATAALCESVPASRVVSFDAGEVLCFGGLSWEVLHMPGHASMQTCFYQRETRQFLSADMLLHIAPMPIVERPPEGQTRVPALPIFMKSLDTVEALEIGTVYPGHGVPFGDHRTVIRRQRDRIQMRKNECLRLLEAGNETIAGIVEVMYADYPPQFRFAGLWMLVGYLDLLKAEGLAEEQEVDGAWHYRSKRTRGPASDPLN